MAECPECGFKPSDDSITVRVVVNRKAISDAVRAHWAKRPLPPPPTGEPGGDGDGGSLP